MLERIKFKIDAFEKRDIEFYTISIPLLGSFIDVNDLWLVSGVVMLFLLYLLGASLEQEHPNIAYILENKKSYVNLIAMNQVLSVLTIGVSRFVKAVEIFFWLTPTFLYLYLLYEDLTDFKVGLIYLPKYHTVIIAIVETTIVLLVAYLNVRCLRWHLRVRDLFSPGGVLA